ncbi:MAG: thioredoxin family protein [Cyanobacteria bacterium]|nr:thioredoxin family protein [Cyanobacteriota bacterium]
MRYFVLLCLFAVLFGCNNSVKSSETAKTDVTARITSEKKPSVIMFYANWCGYCKKMFPTFRSLQEKYKQEINFFYIDIDTKRGAELARQYRTKQGGVPDTLFYNSQGELLEEKLGAIAPEILTKKVESLLN